MKTTPLERDPNDALKRLIDAGSRVRALHPAERAQLFARIERQRARSASTKRWVVAGAGFACALGAALFLLSPGTWPTPGEGPASQTELARASAPVPPSAPSSAPSSAPPSVRRLSLGGRAELELDEQARVSLPSEAELAGHGPVLIRLERGRALAEVAPRAPDEPFSILTPHVKVVVVGTRFSVFVDGSATTVSVEHGRVRVEKAGQALLLEAGQTLRSDDARLSSPEPVSGSERPPGPAAAGLAASEPAASSPAPVKPAPAAPAPAKPVPPRPAASPPAPAQAVASKPAPARASDARCATDAVPRARRACLERAASGAGLTAENALLALGLLERDELGERASALTRFREHQRRHPRGVLAPEVALALVQTLLLDGQASAARAAAADYERRFPDDGATVRRLHELIAAVSEPAAAPGTQRRLP